MDRGLVLLTDPDGTTYKNTKWYCTNTSAVTVDSTPTTWVQDTSGTTYSNGNGLSLTGSTFAVKTGAGLTIDGSQNVAVTLLGTGLLTTTGGLGIIQGASAQVILGNGSGNPTWTSLSGDVNVSNAGVTAVNNTSGSGYMKYGNIIENETPGGSINGTNTSFSLANTPATTTNGTVKLYWNGVRQFSGAGNDFTISGTTITTLFVAATGDRLTADYRI